MVVAKAEAFRFQIVERVGDMNAVGTEAVGNIQVVKSFVAEALEAFEKQCNEAIENSSG